MAHYIKNDSNYHGARSKTRVVGNQNSKMQSSGAVKNRTFSSKNEGNDNGWGSYDNSTTSTCSDTWDDVPYQSSAPGNAWVATNPRKNRKNRKNSGSRTVPLVGNSLSWADEDFPESRPPPVENVWEKRKERLEGRIAMEPTTQTQEERMIQQALELSKRAAEEEELKKRKLEEEYQLQMVLLQTDPRAFTEFRTDEELAEATLYLEPEVPEYLLNEFGDFPKEYNERNGFYNAQHGEDDWSRKNDKRHDSKNKRNEYKWQDDVAYQEQVQSDWPPKKENKISYGKNQKNYPEPVQYQEDVQSNVSLKKNKKSHSKREMNEPQDLNDKDYQSSWSLTENKKSANKIKINEPQHLDQDAQSIWSLTENKKSDDENKQYPDDIEYQESAYSSQSQDIKNKKQVHEKKRNESQFSGDNFVLPSANFNSARSSTTSAESKSREAAKPKISKVIDIFGGWGSKTSQASNFNSSHHQECTESSDKFTSAKVNTTNAGDFPNDLDASKRVSGPKGGLKLERHCIKDNTEHPFKSKTDGHSSFKAKKLPDLNDISRLPNDNIWSESSDTFSTSTAVSFLEATEGAPEIDSRNTINSCDNQMFSNLQKEEIDSKKGASSLVNSIIDDYSSLAIKCTDSSLTEKLPISEKPKDIFTNSSQDNQEGLNFDQGKAFESSRCISQNISKQESNLSNSPDQNQYDISQHFPADVITETENTSLLSHFPQIDLSSSIIPNGNVSVSEDVFKILPPSSCDTNRMNDNDFSLPLFKEPMRDISNGEEVNSNDPPIPAPRQPEPFFPPQPNLLMPNLMHPNAMMSMNNPMAMQQMIMLTNPFFCQQLQQMQMFFASMSILPNPTLQSPFMPGPTFANVQQVPNLNSPPCNVPNIEPAGNANLFPKQEDILSRSPIQPSQPKTHPESLHRVEPHESSLTPPKVEFENAWLREIYSEGTANMNESSFIPPPKGPTANPVAAEHASFSENEMDPKASQSASELAFGNGTKTQHSDWDMKSLENPSGASATVDNYYQPQSENTSNGCIASNGNQEDADVCIGWGNIDNAPKKNVSSWNDDVDGWGDEGGSSAVNSMRDSSRYASQKESFVRQPTSQPFFAGRRR